jgi:hypothetical protein
MTIIDDAIEVKHGDAHGWLLGCRSEKSKEIDEKSVK